MQRDSGLKSPPAPEVVNLQLLAVRGTEPNLIHYAYKVNAADVTWNQGSSIASAVAKKIDSANFSTAAFNHPDAFKQAVTPMGQIIGVLTDDNLLDDFEKAFFSGRYSIEFKRTDDPDLRKYSVEQAPVPMLTMGFFSCVKDMQELIKSLPPT
jgi:hypothetical protein